MTPAEARAQFPVFERTAYMNAGSVGPLSRRTLEAMQSEEAAALAQGRGAASVWEKAHGTATAATQRVAALINVPADRVILTTSTTEGCNIVVTGLRLTPDDEVITTDAEHPGLLMPLLASGAHLRKARVMERPASEALGAVLDEVTPRTKLVALSHVLWLNGHVLPLADIKRETGLLLLVDGAQSVGAISVDASVADWYTVSGQKWLCGPETTGALYVGDDTTLRPQMQASAASTFEHGPLRLAVTHLAPPLVAGMLAALEEVPEWGLSRAAAMVTNCRAALLEAGVEVRTEAGQGTLVSFRTAGEPADVVKQAEAAGVVIRNLPDGWLRASVGWWNDETDIARLVASLQDGA